MYSNIYTIYYFIIITILLIFQTLLLQHIFLLALQFHRFKDIILYSYNL